VERTILLAAVFLVVSAVFSMLGLGGGILYVPILLFAGISIKDAPAISLILIVATSSAALWTYWRNRKVDWKLALVIDPPTDVMAFVGGYFSWLVPELILQLLLAGILFVAAAFMLADRVLARPPAETAGRWWYWHRQFGELNYSVNLPLVLSATGLIGLLSGMIGITGGIIKLPIMVLLCGVPMDVAVATSMVMVAVTAAFGLAGHAVGHAVQWPLGLALAVAALAGGTIGSRISIRTDRTLLRRLFGLLLLGVAARILYASLTL